MGGCCCSSSRNASGGISVYYHYPRDLEANEPLSSTRYTSSAVPVRMVDSNVETLIRDAYQRPNAVRPLVDFTNSQTNSGSTENRASKSEHRQSTDSVPVGDAVGGNRLEVSDRCGGLIGSEPKFISDFVNNSPKIKEEFSHINSSTTFFTEDDVCPTCLEDYDAENPRIITKCKHHFHLSCILEWFERSNNCAVCNRLMEVEDIDLFDRTL
ncbi:hypothetical protein IEQ34_013899 [Dendrobium chrysotoxum]|uniref:RING-type E3 ubiquitin transferase n=1 Tax=Dendrobium chrysotoxum TaxID=161865 RepID=A0AAV7GJ80_DENCH|nr:hypothetical protein IEQ34_013899 [Dendrobium chrysotoxum]